MPFVTAAPLSWQWRRPNEPRPNWASAATESRGGEGAEPKAAAATAVATAAAAAARSRSTAPRPCCRLIVLLVLSTKHLQVASSVELRADERHIWYLPGHLLVKNPFSRLVMTSVCLSVNFKRRSMVLFILIYVAIRLQASVWRLLRARDLVRAGPLQGVKKTKVRLEPYLDTKGVEVRIKKTKVRPK